MILPMLVTPKNSEISGPVFPDARILRAVVNPHSGTRQEVQKWVDERAQETYLGADGKRRRIKANTVRHEATWLTRLWRVLEERDLDGGRMFPLYRVRMPKKNVEKRQIEPETVEKLKAKMPQEAWQVVDFAQLTFCRRLEIFRLKPEHVKLWPHKVTEDGRQLYLGQIHIETSKTGKSRTVPLSWQAAEIVRERLATGAAYLFGQAIPDRFAAACRWAKSIWARSLKAVGQGGHFHGLRAHGAKTAHANGAPVESVSKMLGHSNIPQTEHYLSLKDNIAWAACFAVEKGYRPDTAQPWAAFDDALPRPAPVGPQRPAAAPPAALPQPRAANPRTAGYVLAGPRLTEVCRM